MKKLIFVANIALINSDNKVLLLKRSKNLRKPDFWGFPGGLVDNGENYEVAVKRELFEETAIEECNITINDQQTFLAHGTDEDIEITLFKAKLLAPVNIKIDEYEHSEFGWFDLETISEIENIMSDIPMMIQKLLAK